jgi:hypothetical protein
MTTKTIWCRIMLWIFVAAAPWLVVIGQPTLRRHAHLQLVGDSLASYDSWRSLYNSEKNSQWYQPRFKSATLVAHENPTDIRALVVAAQHKSFGATGRKGVSEEYDKLLQRYPDTAWLIALHLRTAMHWFRDDRLAGTIEDTAPWPGKAPPTKSATPRTFTQSELSRLIRFARHGRRLEPQNTFFDLFLAYFLYCGYRDPESLDVLSQAASKAEFEPHYREDLDAVYWVYNQTRPLIYEEKVAVSSAQLFPHFFHVRHFFKLLAWRNHTEYRRGNHKQVLGTMLAASHLSTLMRKQTRLAMERQVALSCKAVIWRYSIRDLTYTEQQHIKRLRLRGGNEAADAIYRLSAHNFARYARLHGYLKLASDTLNESKSSEQLRRALRSETENEANFFGIDSKTVILTRSLWQISSLTVMQSVLMPLMCGFSFLLMWPLGMQHRVEHRTTKSSDLLMSVGLILGAMSVAAIGASLAGIGWQDLLGARAFCGFLIEDSSDVVLVMAGVFLFAPPFFAFLATAGTMNRRMHYLKDLLNSGKESSQLLTTFTGLALSLIRFHALIMLTIAATSWFLGTMVIGRWLYRLFINNGAMTHSSLTEYFVSHGIIALAPWVVSSFCVLTWWTLNWRWAMPQKYQAKAHYGLWWFQKTLVVHCMLTGYIYLALSLASVEPRRQADNAIDKWVRQGAPLPVAVARE